MSCKPNGAEDGIRTRDPDLGKVMLYQLSYFRIVWILFCLFHQGATFKAQQPRKTLPFSGYPLAVLNIINGFAVHYKRFNP